jgi:hypothetical protein
VGGLVVVGSPAKRGTPLEGAKISPWAIGPGLHVPWAPKIPASLGTRKNPLGKPGGLFFAKTWAGLR